MSYRTVPEREFRERIRDAVSNLGTSVRCVTGPGRSGAVASVYASHMTGLPFIPYGNKVPDKLRPVLVIDTARWTGATIRKAWRKYGDDAKVIAVYDEPPMVRFWYEARATNEAGAAP